MHDNQQSFYHYRRKKYFYIIGIVTLVGESSSNLCRRSDCEQLHCSVNQQLIAGRFGHKGLKRPAVFTQLRERQVCLADVSVRVLWPSSGRRRSEHPDWNVGKTNLSFTRWNQRTQTFLWLRQWRSLHLILCRRSDCEQLHCSINQQLIAGRFGHKGLKRPAVFTQLTKAFVE